MEFIMLKFLRSLQRDDRGVSALEYAVLGGVIVVAVAAGAATVSTKLATVFAAIVTAL